MAAHPRTRTFETPEREKVQAGDVNNAAVMRARQSTNHGFRPSFGGELRDIARTRGQEAQRCADPADGPKLDQGGEPRGRRETDDDRRMDAARSQLFYPFYKARRVETELRDERCR